MIVDGFNKLTLLDYPGLTACIIFTRGCNFNCSFCQNSTLIKINPNEGLINNEEILSYIKKRKNILDGIVISGGEPTIQKDLISFIKEIKSIGLKVKLDTNGYMPDVLKTLLDNNLIDYVAMDIKNSFDKYNQIIKKKIDIERIIESIKILKQSNIEYEFRTTIVKEFHTLEDLINIISYIGNSNYYIQNFVDSDNVNDSNLHGFTNKELISLENTLKKYSKNIFIKGNNNNL